MKKDDPRQKLKKRLCICVTAIHTSILSISIPVYGVETNRSLINEIYSENKQLLELSESAQCLANIYVEAYGVLLEDNIVGFISNESDGKKILDKLEQKYVDNTIDNKDSIKNINTRANISFEKNSVSLNEINSINEIVDKIVLINNTKDEPAVEVSVTTFENQLVDINPPTKEVGCDTLYLGQTKVKDGQVGKKEVLKKDTFINGDLSERDIIEENIIIEPIETIVYKGTQNPIDAGIPFLNHPTNSMGVITSNFGMRSREYHKGIDIGAPTGTLIEAACDGIVSYTGYESGYGNMLIIKHSNEIETVYAHASEIISKQGDKVQKGEPIAKVGSTGKSTGPHLHFELRNNGVAVNPINFIK